MYKLDYYGKISKKSVKLLVKNGLIDFLGSDIHSLKHMKFLQKVIETNELNIVFNNKVKNNELI